MFPLSKKLLALPGENAQLHLCYSDSCNLEARNSWGFSKSGKGHMRNLQIFANSTLFWRCQNVKSLLVWFQLWLHDLSVKICFPWAGFLGGCFSRTRPYESRHISCFVRQIGVKHSPLRRMMVPHVVEKGELLVRSAQPVFKWIEHRSSFNCGTWSFCHSGNNRINRDTFLMCFDFGVNLRGPP